uniref:Uncharacterized protein n=1 Tax=Trypanosoma vivax (strain Y486) TaxID=1055687 RepID=G0TTW7_TRYVY|nr:conserved hypothetical protein [Trypanosoma vivax Y486]
MSCVEELPAEETALETAPVVDINECERLKKSGNERFVSGNVEGALELYCKAIKVAPLKPVKKTLPRLGHDGVNSSKDVPASAETCETLSSNCSQTDSKDVAS